MRSCVGFGKASSTCTRTVSVSGARRRVQLHCAAQDIATPSAASAANLMERLGVGHKDTILLQGFGWESCHAGDWWKKIASMAPEIAEGGFTHIWLPPPSQSVDVHGYLPSQLYNFKSAYGTESELRECVAALKAVGVKPVADLVLNHRCADTQNDKGEWIIFSNAHEPDGVATCAWGPWAVTNNDPEFGGTGAKDTGDDFHAAPDIDHTHPDVQAGYADWIRYLINNVGYEGVRFDFSKGYAGKYAGQYSRETIGSDYFAVGEYWKPLKYDDAGKLVYDQEQSRKEVMQWMNDAGEGVFAFDFVTKGILQEAIRYKKYDWLVDWKNKPHGLLGLAPDRSVTFIDNHDTGSTQAHWRFPRMKKLEGYAYILTHPGMPTVFWEHLFEESDGLKAGILELVTLRRRVGIEADSKITVKVAKPDVYIADIEGKHGTVRVKLGPSREMHGCQATEADGWVKSAKGADFCVWEKQAQTEP